MFKCFHLFRRGSFQKDAKLFHFCTIQDFSEMLRTRGMKLDTLQIWEEFSGNVQGFIRKRVNNAFDADDILQDVFRKIHDNVHNLTDDSKLYSWVFQIARNTIIDHYRMQSKYANLVPIEDEEALIPADIDETDNLNEMVASWIRCMVSELPDKYREAIQLTEIQELTQKQLADHLGISLSGAKSRVQRGREKLKDMLLDCCHLEFDRLGNVVDYTRNEACCKHCGSKNDSCQSDCH